MTSRERIIAAIEHREPDRIPLDFSGHRSSGISAILYPQLRKRLGLRPKPIRVYDLIQQLAIVDEDLLDLLGVDTIELGRGFALEDSDWRDWVLPDGTSCQVPAWSVPEREDGRWILRSSSGETVGHMPSGVQYFEQTYYPLWEEPDRFENLRQAMAESMWHLITPPPGPIDDDALRAGALKLRHRTDRAILGLFGGNLLESGQMLFRNDGFFLLLASEPEKVHTFLDELTEIHLKDLERFLRLVGDAIDIIVFGDDLGMQTGPQISPRMYREFFKPRHSLLWHKAKEMADVKVMLHCCGGVRPLLPDLIEAGLDAINPVQIDCSGMDAAELKADFGSELTFWGGGCDTHKLLPRGTSDQVSDHVRKQVLALRKEGGFVFQQVHNLLADVTPENAAVMFESLARIRDY